jgi:hypothetical protein
MHELTAREIFQETGRRFLHSDGAMRVADDAGAAVYNLRFSAEDCD